MSRLRNECWFCVAFSPETLQVVPTSVFTAWWASRVHAVLGPSSRDIPKLSVLTLGLQSVGRDLPLGIVLESWAVLEQGAFAIVDVPRLFESGATWRRTYPFLYCSGISHIDIPSARWLRYSKQFLRRAGRLSPLASYLDFMHDGFSHVLGSGAC